MAQFNFDLSTVEAYNGKPDPVPAGWYKLAVENSEVKLNSKGSGLILALTVTILEGQYQGRKIFENFNIQHPDTMTQDIGRGKLKSLSNAIGKVVNANEQLHNVPFWGKVKVLPAKDGYDAKNEIATYKHISEQPEGASAAPVAVNTPVIPPAPIVPPTTPQPVPASNTPPAWNGAPEQPWSAPAADKVETGVIETAKTAASEPIGGGVVNPGEVPPWVQNVTLPQ